MSQQQDRRVCDLIMKGGITSGVVYPSTILELAKHYDFRSIGGTSAGAIAAAFAAAFQYGRRIDAARARERLEECQRQLGVGGFLEKLFHPNRSVAGVFAMLLLLLKNRRFAFAMRLAAGPFLIGALGWAAIARYLLGFLPEQRWHYLLLLLAAVLLGTVLAQIVTQVYKKGLALALLKYRPQNTAGLGPLQRFFWHAKAVLYWLRGAALSALVTAVFALPLFWYFSTLPQGRQYSGTALGMLFSALLVGILWCIGKVLHAFYKLRLNNFGLVKGHLLRGESREHPALTDWIASCLDYIACRDLADGQPASQRYDTDDADADAVGRAPLSFAMLQAERSEEAISLMMVSSNVSQKQAYTLPFSSSECFVFREREMLDYFPPRVVRQMMRGGKSRSFAIDGGSLELTLPSDFYFVPTQELPVVVAVRLSLSFPLLFSAVPLYTIASRALNLNELRQTASFEIPEAGLHCNWFSDGGLSSNLPMHFFDSWLPGRPTFGINLTAWSGAEVDKARAEMSGDAQIRQPGSGLDAVAQSVTDVEDFLRPAGPRPAVERIPSQEVENRIFIPEADRAWQPEYHPISGLPAYLLGLFGTTQNNRDNAYMRMPGVRDRVASIQLKGNEGGINLGMDPDVIRLLGALGTKAGEQLERKFAGAGFERHRWVRARVLLPALARGVKQMAGRLDTSAPDWPQRFKLWAGEAGHYFPAPAAGEGSDWHGSTAEALQQTLAGIKAWQAVLDHPDPHSPQPSVALKTNLER